MRSAWSPTRSMSFETFFVVWPSCLLAFPTDLATALRSMSGSPGLAIARGTLIPRIVFLRPRLLSIIPPATPTAVAPTATAGPLTLAVAPLMLPTIPLLPVPFWLAVLRLELLLLLRLGLAFRVLPLVERELLERLLELVWRPRALLERVPPLLARELLERPPELVLRPLALLEPEALLRPPDAGFERDELREAAAERFRDEAPPERRLALAFGPPLDELCVPFLLLDAGLVAIPFSLCRECAQMHNRGTQPRCRATGMQAVLLQWIRPPLGSRPTRGKQSIDGGGPHGGDTGARREAR